MTGIRERHVPSTVESDLCWRCLDPWPCDAIREADRADRAEAALADLQEGRTSLVEQYLTMVNTWAQTANLVHVARADAERLARAMANSAGVTKDRSRAGVCDLTDEEHAALAAHEETTK